MPGKVVHLSDEVHSTSKRKAKEDGMSLKEWVEKLIREHLAPKPVPETPRRVVEIRAVHTSADPVRKKPLTSFEDDDDDGIKPWERPPFWANRSHTPQTSEEEEEEWGDEEDKDPGAGEGDHSGGGEPDTEGGESEAEGSPIGDRRGTFGSEGSGLESKPPDAA